MGGPGSGRKKGSGKSYKSEAQKTRSMAKKENKLQNKGLSKLMKMKG